MNNSSPYRKALLACGALAVLQPFTVLAVDYQYIYNGVNSSAVWSNNSTAVWSPAAPAGGPTASDNVTIPDQALKALGIDGARSANNFTFLKADAFNVVGGAAGNNTLSIVGDLDKSGGGLLTFRASGSNLLALDAGNLTISSGEVAMGSTSVTLASLDVSGETSLSGSGSALSLNIAEGGTASLGALSMGNGTVLSIRNVSSGTATTKVTSLSGSGIIRNANTGGTGSGILVIDSADSASYGGTIIDNSTANPDSKLAVVKEGSGTQVFTGNNTYTGNTTVTAGSLLISGNQSSATGVVTVAPGATLGGSGIIGGATTINGNLQPGNSPGILTFTNNLTLSSTAVTTMEINGTARGSQYDGINVGSLLTYDGTLTLALGTTFGVGTYSFNLFDFGSQSGTFSVINLTGDYSGSLTGSGDVRGLTSGVNTWTFTHSTGDLGLTVIPEPATWALLAASLTALVLFRRRRSC